MPDLFGEENWNDVRVMQSSADRRFRRCRYGREYFRPELVQENAAEKSPAKPETPVAATPAQDAAPTIKFEKYTLPNGLVVILSEDHRLPLVSTKSGITSARRMNFPDAPALPNLFEHMMFEGSKHVPGNGHIRFLEAAGASDLNGTTI